MSKFTVTKIRESYRGIGQYLGAAFVAPSKAQAQFLLFLFGVSLLSVGLMDAATAQGVGSAGPANLGNYNDTRFAEATNRVFAYIEGSFGALIMVASGLGAIISAAFGQYRAALALLVVAVGSFILRSMVSTFFNDQNIK